VSLQTECLPDPPQPVRHAGLEHATALPNATLLAFAGMLLIGKGTRCQIFIIEVTSNRSKNLLATFSINP